VIKCGLNSLRDDLLSLVKPSHQISPFRQVAQSDHRKMPLFVLRTLGNAIIQFGEAELPTPQNDSVTEEGNPTISSAS